jgi:hypothetical protein
VFLGYPFGVKAYKLLDLQTGQIFLSQDVHFHESIFPFHSFFFSPSILPSNSITHPLPSSLPPSISIPTSPPSHPSPPSLTPSHALPANQSPSQKILAPSSPPPAPPHHRLLFLHLHYLLLPYLLLL